jgi:uncharacterized membrane protein YhaH (DUF805 family)
MGWILFIFAVFGISVCCNAAMMKGDANYFIVSFWVVFILASLFGWYKLAIKKGKDKHETPE